MDPSAIPNFGGAPKRPEGPEQQGEGAQGPQTAPLVVPDKELIKQLLDRMKLKHTEDKQQDLVAPWKNFRTYFLFRGNEQQKLMSVRTFYDRRHSLEDKGKLLELVDEWNRRTLWPKVYTHTSDDGVLRLIGEVQMLIGQGVALDHFVSSLVSWVRSGVEFERWLIEQLGLEPEEESQEQSGDAKPKEA